MEITFIDDGTDSRIKDPDNIFVLALARGWLSDQAGRQAGGDMAEGGGKNKEMDPENPVFLWNAGRRRMPPENLLLRHGSSVNWRTGDDRGLRDRRFGKQDGETGFAAGPVQGEGELMTLQNFPDQGQTDSLAVRFGAEKGSEELAG